MTDTLSIRSATENDTELILRFIKELADYEHLLDQVIVTKEELCEQLFVKKYAEVLIGELNGEAVGFALFFHNFSTFLGKPGLYLEDLYVIPGARGKGLGKLLFKHLAKLALERNCGRFEWWCLDWNKPSIDFYLSLGAKPMSDWTVYRITGDDLEKLGKK